MASTVNALEAESVAASKDRFLKAATTTSTLTFHGSTTSNEGWSLRQARAQWDGHNESDKQEQNGTAPVEIALLHPLVLTRPPCHALSVLFGSGSRALCP